MTKAVGAALVPEILAQSPPAVKVGAGVFSGPCNSKLGKEEL